MTTVAAQQRLPNWQVRLGDLVAARLDMPFEWGRRDCCLWAADAVLAVTGIDLAADLRGSYSGQAQALALIKRVRGLGWLCEQRLGAEVQPAMAQPGDVGLVEEAGAMPALVVATGSGWHGQAAHGLVPVAHGAVLRTWRCTRG